MTNTQHRAMLPPGKKRGAPHAAVGKCGAGSARRRRRWGTLTLREALPLGFHLRLVRIPLHRFAGTPPRAATARRDRSRNGGSRALVVCLVVLGIVGHGSLWRIFRLCGKQRDQLESLDACTGIDAMLVLEKPLRS